jgi:glycine cleavage system H lipoate-binding protein/catechol 2,3-dioxygenase-like lactoylglutathione lyase family enzyme
MADARPETDRGTAYWNLRERMSETPSSLRYSPDHTWVDTDSNSGLVRVGLTDYAQDMLGDVIHVTLPKQGQVVPSGEPLGEIDSTKTISEVVSPMTGTVLSRNQSLIDTPELINEDPLRRRVDRRTRSRPHKPRCAACSSAQRRRLRHLGRGEAMNYKLEVLTIPVTDVDAAKEFYTGRLGFTLEVDYFPNATFRVVQLAPTGSTCSIQFGLGLSDARPGSTQMTYLVVSDVQAGHGELARRGVDVGAIRHKSAVDDWQGQWMEGVDPIRRDYASVFDVVDPDGNRWLVREIGFAGRIDSSKAVRRRAATVTPEKG